MKCDINFLVIQLIFVIFSFFPQQITLTEPLDVVRTKTKTDNRLSHTKVSEIIS